MKTIYIGILLLAMAVSAYGDIVSTVEKEKRKGWTKCRLSNIDIDKASKKIAATLACYTPDSDVHSIKQCRIENYCTIPYLKNKSSCEALGGTWIPLLTELMNALKATNYSGNLLLGAWKVIEGKSNDILKLGGTIQ